MKVIVAIDESPYSEDVIASVKKKPWPRDTQFRVLTVLEELCDLENEFGDILAGLDAKRERAAEQFCQQVRSKLQAGIPTAKVHYEVRKGSPKLEIINSALEWSADKIVLGAHGQRGCPHNLIGSVSRAVAGHAPCSVEIIRDKVGNKRSGKKQAEAEAKDDKEPAKIV